MPWFVVLPLGRGFIHGDLGVLGLQHRISFLRVLFGRVLFWGVGFLGCMGKMHLWSPNRNFFEWVMVTCLCVHAFLGACLCLLVWGVVTGIVCL